MKARMPEILVAGFFLAIVPSLFAATPRYIVDDEAFIQSATESAIELQKQGKLVDLKALLAQPPSKVPVKFAAPVSATIPPTKLYDRLREGTVAIGTIYHCNECSDWHLNLATGFAIAEGGIVSTCGHVIAFDEVAMKEAYVIAVDSEGHAFPVYNLLANDADSDTCLVRVGAPNLRPLPVRAGALPGERVFCLSHPNGHFFMFTQGIVARVSRSSSVPEDDETEAHPKIRPTLSLEVTTEYCPGSSGGPIVDENGNVVAQVDLIDIASESEEGFAGVVAARTATAAEEILRFADPANRPVVKLETQVDPSQALSALHKAIDARKENKDERVDEQLYKKIVSISKRTLPLMADPAQRREFALLAANVLVEDPTNPQVQKILPLLREIVSDANGSPEEKTKASNRLILFAVEDVGDAASFAIWEKNYLAHAATFPDDPELPDLKLSLLDLTEQFAADRLEALARNLSGDPDDDVAEQAKETIVAIQTKKTLQSTPLEMKFTAIDGTEVDVTKMRGKVLLIDFWATWCAPCMEELPNLKKAYAKLHERGFEIIGISGDVHKKELEAVLKKQGMTWLQYFNNQGGESELMKRFGISAYPTMWLVDKKGMVVDFEAKGKDLSVKIEKLLAQ